MPLCPGGKDRWRFLDSDGAGTWICTHCGSGAGVDLVMKFTGLPFKEVAQKIERVLGDAPIRPAKAARDDKQIRAGLDAMWRCAAPVRRHDLVDQWLRSRGIALDVFPSCLRTASKVRYSDDAGAGSFHPAMLAKVTAVDGTPATIHRTYLTPAAEKGAVEHPRKLYSTMPKGAAVRLAPVGTDLGIAEGIETALACQIIFGVPVWAGICANGVKNFTPPRSVKRLLIFGDNDDNSVGQAAAYHLAARLAANFRTEVHISTDRGSDWNDVLLRGGR